MKRKTVLKKVSATPDSCHMHSCFTEVTWGPKTLGITIDCVSIREKMNDSTMDVKCLLLVLWHYISSRRHNKSLPSQGSSHERNVFSLYCKGRITDAGRAHLSTHSVISLHYSEWAIASQARSCGSSVSVQLRSWAHLELSLCWILIRIETDHSLANRSGLHHTGAVHRCSKWVWDAFTAYIWDCGRPPPFSTSLENGLVIWLLDWKMNVQSLLSSNWTLSPTDVAPIRLMHSNPVWNTRLQRHCRSSCSLWMCPCVLLLSEPHRLTQTNSHRLDWFGISNWTWVDSVHSLRDEWVSAQTWSGAKDCIMNSSSPNRLQQTYSKEKSLTFFRPTSTNSLVSSLIFQDSVELIFHFIF